MVLWRQKKHLSYEIIWQIGDMDDTGYDTDNLSAIWAEDVLLRFADHLMFDVPNVTIASKCCLEDPEWKPPFEAGIVITNFAFNGDESTPHLHMTFVPYSDNCSRGQKTQNALAQTFVRMGYETTMEQAQGELSRVTEELDEATRKKEIAMDLYHAISTDSENTDLFDKVVDLIYENEQLRNKIQVLQDKLEKAYEFMKQFVINGRNMLDVFRE